MERVQNIIKMEILSMKVILSMIKKKVMENLFLKMVLIIQVNLKMIYEMEKDHYIIKMEILYMRVIGLMIKKRVMEK